MTPRDYFVNESDTQNKGYNMGSKEAILSSNIAHDVNHEYVTNVRKQCRGKLVYTYSLPREFNEELIERCTLGYKRFCDRWFCIPCNRIENNGFGPPVPSLSKSKRESMTDRRKSEDAKAADGSLELVPRNAWFRSDQFSLEVIFYEKMKAYECITRNADEANGFYIPYLGGLDMAFTLFSGHANIMDELQQKLVGWLLGSSVWQRNRQKAHFMVLGHIAWDFDRRFFQGDAGDDGKSSYTWGSSLFHQPLLHNVTWLLIERKLNVNQHDMGLPYPTLFHPSTPTDIFLWQEQVRKSRRSWFVTFVGGSRRKFDKEAARNVRQILMTQCHEEENQTISFRGNSLQGCRSYECIGAWEMRQKRMNAKLGESGAGQREIACEEEPEEVVRALVRSVFCLQPKGDSATRKGVFDSIIAGCIPVLFANETVYLQYLWHLPRDPSSYSVYIPETKIMEDKEKIVELLSQMPYTRIKSMQRNIRQLIPRIVYSSMSPHLTQDAFSIALHSYLTQTSTSTPKS
ncbi:hypothetical protein KP509_1Z125100 [Ceratopteris richardii]|nr:hypothetical protein KP509_1Z125100 [Ceratopteris richardii]